MLYAVELKKNSRGLEMYLHTGFQNPLLQFWTRPHKRAVIDIGRNTVCRSNLPHPLIKDENGLGRMLSMLKRFSRSS